MAAEPLVEHLTTDDRVTDDLLFTAPDGRPVQLNLCRQRFCVPAVRNAGLVHLGPHDLRHTAVALWIAAGANPKEVATRAGHSSVSLALDRYGHLFPGSEQPLNDDLDTLADASRSAGRPDSCDHLSGNVSKHPADSMADVARTPDDSAPTAQRA